MQFNQEMRITGIRQNVYDVNGTKGDLLQVFAEITLKASGDNKAMGTATQQYNYKSSTAFDEFAGLEFPFLANCSVELVTNGKDKDLSLLLHQITPLKSQAKKAS